MSSNTVSKSIFTKRNIHYKQEEIFKLTEEEEEDIKD